MEDSRDEIIAEPKEPKPSSIFFNILTNIEYVFTTYGWLIIGGIFLLFHFREKILLHFLAHYEKFYDSSTLNEPLMDAQTRFARQEAMKAARRRMQEAYAVRAAEFAVKQKERDEAKRQEMLQDWGKNDKRL